jgi:hypothetical protein
MVAVARACFAPLACPPWDHPSVRLVKKSPPGPGDGIWMPTRGAALRPATIESQVPLCRSVKHDDANILPCRFLEVADSYTRQLNSRTPSLTRH